MLSSTRLRLQDNSPGKGTGDSSTTRKVGAIPPVAPMSSPAPMRGEVPFPSEAPSITKFGSYNKQWESLGPKDADISLPSPDFTRIGFLKLEGIGGNEDIRARWGLPIRINVNTKVFFIESFDLDYKIKPKDERHPESTQLITFTITNEVKDIEKLIRHIKLKEMSRWHPDRLNKRTGTQTGLDENKGVQKGVVKIPNSNSGSGVAGGMREVRAVGQEG